MKKCLHMILCAVLAVCAAATLAACGDAQLQESATETTAPAASAAPLATIPPLTTIAPLKTETDLTRLHAPKEPGDLFTGYWKITSGAGAQLQNFVFSFDGSNGAYLLIGTMGYCAGYEVSAKDGQDVFTTQMMFGLNGDYTYEFAKDKLSVVLTSLSDETTTTMQKLDSFSSIPDPVKNPVIDEALLGAWKDETGEYLYFDKNGIFYDSQANVTFTFYTYSAQNGSIQMTYTMSEPMEENATYEVHDDKLTYDGNEFTRVAADELM